MKHGYGETRGILESISGRPDFLPNVKRVIGNMNTTLDNIDDDQEEDTDADYFDPKNIFGGE